MCANKHLIKKSLCCNSHEPLLWFDLMTQFESKNSDCCWLWCLAGNKSRPSGSSPSVMSWTNAWALFQEKQVCWFFLFIHIIFVVDNVCISSAVNWKWRMSLMCWCVVLWEFCYSSLEAIRWLQEISSYLFLISFYNELTKAINIRSGGKVSWIFNPHIYGQCVFVLDYLTWGKLTVCFFCFFNVY